jgi:hypothetical protein
MRCSAILVGLCLSLFPGAVRSSAADETLRFFGGINTAWDDVAYGLFDPPATFVGGGPVTQMGSTNQQGTLFLELPTVPMGLDVLIGYGSVLMTAANGDQLSMDYEGLLSSATGEAIGTFAFTGGTGQLANAIGGGTFNAWIDLSFPDNQPMVVLLNGTIRY